MPDEFEYDLMVIGSGPAGQRAAIQAAKMGRKVAVVERKTTLGGVCINTGTIPSKTLREAALYLSGFRERNLYGASYSVKERITIDDLLYRTNYVIRHELEIVRHQLRRNGIELLAAEARFTGPHSLRLDYVDGRGEHDLKSRNIIIATGTSVTQGSGIPFDGRYVFTSDDILNLDKIPSTLVVVGGGVIGLEYASIFSALGVRVTVIDKRDRLLDFVDHEIVDSLVYHLRQNRLQVRLGEEVRSVELAEDSRGKHVQVKLASGKIIMAEKALVSIGRTGATARLDLKAAGLAADDRGRLTVNEHFQTTVPHIYAVGDVIGFPSLASTSMEQGRMAASHAFGISAQSNTELFPYGIYTVPEMSIVGKTEEELTKSGVPYEVGKAYYREVARGQIIGDSIGMLKLIFHLETRKLLGVHIIGEGASELIHIGQAVMSFNGTVDYFVESVFNYPTLAEAYKTAAFDGINRLRG